MSEQSHDDPTEPFPKIAIDLAALPAPTRDQILQAFSYATMPPKLQEIARPFMDVATRLVALPRSVERAEALDALIVAKDAAVDAVSVEGL